MMKRKHLTLDDVAKDAGVSRATVSMVISGSSLISKATTRKVLDSIQKMGYVYNRMAANLRSQRSSAIAVIINDDLGNPYFSELLTGVYDELNDKEYTVLLGNAFDSNAKQERLLETMLEYKVGGLVFCPVAKTSRVTIEKLNHLDIPTVLVARYLQDIDTDYVGSDFVRGAQAAVQHLIDQGHRRIAFVCGIHFTSTYQDRLTGFQTALKLSRLDIDDSLVINGPATRDGGYRAVREILKHLDPPTALLCYNDIVALGAVCALWEMGIEPGRDIAIVGFDNILEAAVTCRPNLTTAASDTRQIGMEAARLLIRRINGFDGPPVKIIFPSTLIIRDSSTIYKQPFPGKI